VLLVGLTCVAKRATPRSLALTRSLYAPTVADSWHVTIRGQATKFVTAESIEYTPEHVVFIEPDGQVILLVHTSELISVERYVEPPF
jgi:hypothetical protein